jgi:hypothetical protein
VRKLTGSWHSVRTFTLMVLGVRDGVLGIIAEGYAFTSLGVFVGPNGWRTPRSTATSTSATTRSLASSRQMAL